jgi:penicillin-binding protein 2
MVLVACLVFLALIGRLCQLQVLEGDHFARRAERNLVDVVDVEAPRGRIFDVDGRPLATNRPAYTLYVTGRTRTFDEVTKKVGWMPMPDTEVELLTSLIDFVDDVDRDGVLAAIHELREDEKDGRYPAAVRRNLSWEEYAKIQTRLEELASWVEIRESSRRYYPEGELVAFITGYVGGITKEGLRRSAHLGYRVGDRVGLTGIERQWENYLRGRLGSRSRVVDNRRREVKTPPPAALRALPPDRDPIPGQDLYLTIDLELQRVASEGFENVMAGALVAMEADTGRMLAMVSVPAIDPNRRQQPISHAEYKAWTESPLKPFLDKTVQEHFFPGSTYKVVSALAALEDPQFDPDEEVECAGYLMYGNRRFRDTHRHGTADLEQAIVQSCNVYFFTLAKERSLSLERMERWARMLGLGERTGLGVNGEVKGRIPTEAFEAREGTYQQGVRLNSAIGQGNVKVTVLQLAVVYAAIANGGYVVTPYIVDRIVTNDHKLVFKSGPQLKNDDPVMDPADRERIHRGLVGVVNEEVGTAYSERLPNIIVAGKTGTAQIGRETRREDQEIEGWDVNKPHAWFAAYAPADDPKLVVVAFVEHGGTGADAAAPIAMEVISRYLGSSEPAYRPRAYGIPPDLPGERAREQERARTMGGGTSSTRRGPP